MALGLHIFEDVSNLSVGADDEGGPRNAHHLFAIHVFFLQNAEGLGDFLVGVGQQREWEVIVVGKSLLCFGRIRGDAKQHRAGLLNLTVCVAEPASFQRSARGVGAGIEEENHGLAAQVLEGDFFLVLILQREVRRFIMNIHGRFLKKLNSGRVNAGAPVSGRQYYLKILYRAACALAVLTCACTVPAAQAQEERPQITPGERKVPRKKDAGPRAVAVLQLSAKGKASLVPIAILINGKFWDAGAYKAAPVPMALEPGTVYEAERAGSSQGLFTVNTALHSTAINAQNPWIGTGSWIPAGSEKAETKPKAEGVPTGIDSIEGPPRLTKNSSAQPTAPSTAPTNTPASPPPKGSDSGDEPPRLSKPAAPPASTTPSSGPSSGPESPPRQGDSPGSAQSPPSQSKPGDAKPSEDRPKSAESDSGAGQGNRPRLRRGKPAESFADDEIPGYSKPGVPTSPSAAKATDATALGPVQLIPAISDAGGPDPHSYGFEWLKGEEEQRKEQMIALAKDQLRAYLQARAKASITPKATTALSSHHAAAKKAPEPVLSNEQMTAYDLWSMNKPVLVFSAQAQVPPPASGGSSADLQYSILLVAYPDIYNNLHKLYSGITDKYHLDLTPRLELVDAVDADGDGRGELLFRETSDAGSGWVIYRATADKLWKVFDSLNPE